VFEAKGIRKQYKRQNVVEDVSFYVQPGECLGVTGHNGSGKSTLLSICAQTIQKDAGSVLYDGKSIWGARQFLRRHMGYVPQHNCLLPDLTVKETLLFFSKVHGVPQKALLSDNGAAAQMGLLPLLHKKTQTLSGGMQKRLSIALALMHGPRILLLDEILSSLDRTYRSTFHRYMLAHLKNGGSILYCSHEAEELMSFSNRILVLRTGKTIFYGDTQAMPKDAASLDKMLSPL
jgi:ABC-type multidrug transport system ATPase subunit